MTLTAIIVISLIAITIVLDLFLWLTGRETISDFSYRTTHAHVWIAAVLGALLFHLITGAQ